jgi:GNAT superfamily N-acetyltransferase
VSKTIDDIHAQDGSIIQFEIRAAVEEDIPALIELFKETIPEVYGQILPKEILEPWIEGERLREDVGHLWHYMIVAEEADNIVAASARIEDLIALLWVHPAHHKKGIGSALLNIVERDVIKSGYETAKLDCFSKNDRAMRFYLNRGWESLFEEMDNEVGALKTMMTKRLTENNSQAVL